MRTTLDLPDDLHRQAKAIAREQGWTLSQAVVWLMRRGLADKSS
ncbi:MAG TPA: antitoxin, partial [Dehalococcoidia bacterium]|nr:antitoxin [Dehalococcoidia bacterium]